MVVHDFGIFPSKSLPFAMCVRTENSSFRQELISRINESKKLNDEYQAYFHKTKGKLLESANERQWNFR